MAATRISEEEWEKWNKHAQEELEGSVSQLIRFSVTREIDNAHDSQSKDSTPESQSHLRTDSELLEGLQRIEQYLDEVEERLGAVERELKSEGPKYDLQKVLFSLLPATTDAPSQSQPPQWAKTVDDITTELGAESTSEIKEALEELRKQTAQVVRVGGGPSNKEYYYKRE